MSQKDYSPFLYPSAIWNVYANSVHRAVLTSALPVTALAPGTPWEDVSGRNK